MNLKLLFVLLPMLFFSGIANNQTQDTLPEPNLLKALVTQTEELATASEELKQAERVRPKTKVVYRVKKVQQVKEVLASEQKVILILGGVPYEVEPMLYKGYAIINADSVIQNLDEDDWEVLKTEPVTDTVETAPEPGRWDRIKMRFKHKQ